MQAIASFIAKLEYDSLPPAIIKDAKYRILDWLGSALAGVRYKPSHIVTQMAIEAGGVAQATILQSGLKAPVAQAALVNGVIGHVAELDDGHRLAIAHPGAVTVPVALAVAECFNKTGKELLTAIVAGYEVLIRLGIAVNPAHYQIWHATGTCGTFAAAATAASLLKLEPLKVQMALGIAGTMAAGLQASFGTHSKPLNAGHACQSGVQAALLALHGFTGPGDIFCGDKGFIRATTTDYNGEILAEIGKSSLMTNTAFFKVYASCGHTNSPLTAMFRIIDRYDLPLDSIKQVQIETYRTAVELTAQLKYDTEEAAKFSLPYCIAAALVHKKVTLAEFSPDKLNDPVILGIARRVQVIEDPEATKVFPQRRATVKVELANKQVIVENVEAADDTPLYDVLENKFLSLTASSLDKQAAQQIKEMVLCMEKINDLQVLMQHLRLKR
jgi:2-methylcitrate dehydratase PrpD